MCVLLAGLTLAVFWPVVHCGFINLDDPDYVTNNPHVLGGLTLENIGWAFRTGYRANWHPLTWLSHMADVELIGVRPGFHHLTNLLFHTANTVLLFWVLNRMTGALGRSALMAALFAVHPLHVESVAWISERKDVLSTFFFLLTLWAYARYAESQRLKAEVQSPESKVQSQESGVRSQNPGAHITPHAAGHTHPASRYYVLSLFCFALGLMSKPMLVTLPFVLLLLDYWPLKRTAEARSQKAEGEAGGTVQDGTLTWRRLVWEKIPFFVLATISSVVTYCVQKEGAAMSLQGGPTLASRLGNAGIAYLRYMGKMIWPAHLAVVYPHPRAWPAWEVALAAAALAALSVAAVRVARRHPVVPVGWFWYLGTLVPVIGLIQVGEQSMADRYSYIPMIGLFVVLAWGAWELVGHWPQRDFHLGFCAVLLVGLLAVGTRMQLRHWRTGRALLEHSLAAGGGSAVVHTDLGILLAREGNLAEAERHFNEALRVQPGYYGARLALAAALASEDKSAEAIQAVTNMDAAWEASAHQILAEIFLDHSKLDEALGQVLGGRASQAGRCLPQGTVRPRAGTGPQDRRSERTVCGAGAAATRRPGALLSGAVIADERASRAGRRNITGQRCG